MTTHFRLLVVLMALAGTVSLAGCDSTDSLDPRAIYRIEVEWDASPDDLDSHLTGPDGAGGRFHVYFSNPLVDNHELEEDFTDGPGPEVVRLLADSYAPTPYAGAYVAVVAILYELFKPVSRTLSAVAAFFGLAGCAFGTWFTWWTSAVNYPLIIGGKPFWSLPAFIPIIFESQNEAGCTNIATLNLTINNSTTTEESVTSCDSYTWNGTE